MSEGWFNTFQAFYIYVKKTRFTIIRKSKSSIRIILNNESSAFTRTWAVVLKSPKLASSGQWWQLLNVFIMVCSWDLIMVGFTEKFWAWKPESDGENLFSFVTVIDGLANVVRARSCLLERVEPQLLWCRKLPFAFSQHWGFHNFVWILHWRVVVVLPRRLHRNRQGIVRFGGLWPSQYLSVQRLLSLACWLLSF